MNYFDIIAPEHKEKALRVYKDYCTTGTLPDELELEIIRKDGFRRWILNRYSANNRGDTSKGYFLIATDITERRQTEYELRKLASFASNNPAPILQTGLDGTIMQCNPIANQLLGEQLLGELLYELFPQIDNSARNQAGTPIG